MAQLFSLGGMTTRSHFDCPGVALRLFGVSVVCAILFILDRVIPALLGFEFSRFQHATLYLWLLVLPALGYSWILQRSRRLSSASASKRWLVAVGIALPLSIAFAFVTITLVWISG